MLIKCNRIISPITNEELRDSAWLRRNKVYHVLALEICNKWGVQVCIQTEHYNEPHFTPINGFEIVSQKIPLSWVTKIKEIEDKIFITMLPKSWSYESFFEDLENEESRAVILFNQEIEKIYQEEKI